MSAAIRVPDHTPAADWEGADFKAFRMKTEHPAVFSSLSSQVFSESEASYQWGTSADTIDIMLSAKEVRPAPSIEFTKREVSPSYQQRQVLGSINADLLQQSCEALVQNVEADNAAKKKKKHAPPNKPTLIQEPRKLRWRNCDDESRDACKANESMMNYLMAHALRAGADPVKPKWTRQRDSGATNHWDFGNAAPLEPPQLGISIILYGVW